jgi:antitoxin component of MazEF toxin-antitoxin module
MTQTARITDEWLPLPETLLNQLQWKEGDVIAVEVVGDTLICTKTDAITPARPQPNPRLPRR